jgi:hypothetical protein
MYKPNGEERMTKEEERLWREAVIERRMERAHALSCVAEVLGTTMYADLLGSEPRRELIEAGFSNLR